MRIQDADPSTPHPGAFDSMGHRFHYKRRKAEEAGKTGKLGYRTLTRRPPILEHLILMGHRIHYKPRTRIQDADPSTPHPGAFDSMGHWIHYKRGKTGKAGKAGKAGKLGYRTLTPRPLILEHLIP